MKFLYAKNNVECQYCKTMILRGELVARTFYKDQASGNTFIHSYHADNDNGDGKDCFELHHRAVYRTSLEYWKQKLKPRKKIGRPQTVAPATRQKRNRLVSLKIYHEKAGNLERAAEVELEIKNLEGGL
jgi:hypothetical protein